MTLATSLLIPAAVQTISDSQPTALSYGKLQSYGTMQIASDTDGSKSEFTILTSGYGVASCTAANGLAIGYDTLKWKNNNIIHAGNISSQTVANATNCLPRNTNSSVLPEFSSYPNYLLGIEAFAAGGTVKWKGWADCRVGYASSAGSVSWSNVTGGVCNSGQFCFSKTDDHAIQVGNIRGYGSNGQSGNYIHMYERVHIGSPSGWGSRSAPSYGLSTYGGAWLATDTGNVGLGCTDPGYKLDVRGNARTTGRYYSNEWIEFNNATGLYFPNYYGGHFFPNIYTTYGNFVILGSKNGYTGIQFGDSTGKMTLMDSGSAKGIYQENWSWILLQEGDNTYLNANRFYSNSSGSYWNSDRSLKKYVMLVNKEDLSTLFNVSDKLIKKFIWKNTNKKTTYGFIAQEIERYVPEAVEVNPKTKKKSVNHNSAFSKIMASLIQEIKKQRKEIDQLKKEMKEMNK